MRVLLIVDLQQDFCPGGALAVAGGDQIVPVVNSLMKEGGYDLILASRDWHPMDHCSFASSYPSNSEAAPFTKIKVNGREQCLWPDHCVSGTPGAEYHPGLLRELIQGEVLKGCGLDDDHYSAFATVSGRKEPSSLQQLIDREAAARGVSRTAVELDCVGLALDYCVSQSAISASEIGYRSRILLEATRAVDPSPQRTAELLRDLARNGVEVISVRERLQPVERREVGRGPAAGERSGSEITPSV